MSEHAGKHGPAEIVNFQEHDNTGEHLKEITGGGADVVIDCVGMDGKMSVIEKIETAMKLQGGSKSAIEIATQAVRKGGTVSFVGVYGARYNNFPLGDFFARNITLKMGQCPAHSYIPLILDMIHTGEFDATDVQDLNDREIATAYLLTLKRAGREYGWSAMEASNPEIRSFLENAFQMSSHHAYDIWQWMVKKGYYPLQTADATSAGVIGSMYHVVEQPTAFLQ